MMLSRAVDRLRARLIDTDTYWNVREFIEEFGVRLEERFADPPEFAPRRWAFLWIVAPLSKLVIWPLFRTIYPEVDRHRARISDSSSSDLRRRRELFLGVMAGLRFGSIIKSNRFGWSDREGKLARRLVSFALHCAGMKINEAPVSHAVSAWDGNVPNIYISPNVYGHGRSNLNRTLFHELFHLSAPSGRGLCNSGHVKELLANRFATEMSHPIPAIVRAAETSAHALIHRGVNPEELMWATNRPMFSAIIPASREFAMGYQVVRGHLVAPAPETFSARELWQDDIRVDQSPDNLLLWATALLDYYPPHVTWGPPGRFFDDLGDLYLLSREGLYYRVGKSTDAWLPLAEAGVLDFRGNDYEQVSYYTRNIPEINLGNCTIGGGHYLIVRHVGSSVSIPKSHEGLNMYHHLLAIEDKDGYLTSAWSDAIRSGVAGPLISPEDRQEFNQSHSFNDWWSVDDDEWFYGRDSSFDTWQTFIDSKFMGIPPRSEVRSRERVEVGLIALLLRDHDLDHTSGDSVHDWAAGETWHPPIRAHRIAQLLLEHDKRRGSWIVRDEPIHNWAKELTDNPVLQKAVVEYRSW